ncbi:MAG: SulP family inorganic anion transporter [Candidatus Thiothrix sulfatifontis]|nr:MAG: SulP family inorganic anion transporter [Candidatus Thiothrix sulfatifontis]
MGSWLVSLLSDWKDRFTPYRSWIGELKNPEVLKADAMAGLTVALVLIPQSMAYAYLAGLPPYVGLYAAFLPVIVAAVFGSSRQLGTGPVAIGSLMSAAALQPYVHLGTEAFMLYSALLVLISGFIQLMLGLVRAGTLVDFLSNPVIVGFTNAAAIIIAGSQIPSLLGIPLSSGKFEHYYQYVYELANSLFLSHFPTLIIGVFSLFSLFVLKKYAPKLPSVLITVAITTVIAWAVDLEGRGGSVVGEIPQGLPSFQIPYVSLDIRELFNILLNGFIIGLMGFVEAISISKAMASQTRQRLSANQELVGQGLAKIVSGLFQGYIVSGSFSRSAVNFASGAITGFSSVVTGLLVALTLLFLTPLLYHLPQATLAAVIIMALINLVKVAPIKHAWKVEPHDGVVAVVTFVATLAFAPHLDKGILLGVVLSLGLFLYRTMSPALVEVARDADGTMRDAAAHSLKTSDSVAVYRFDGDLYFANTGYLEGKLLNNVAKKPGLKVLILDMESIDQVDSTGEEMLEKLADRLKFAGIEFYIARTKLRVYEAFQRSGLAKHIGEERFFRERKYAINYAKEQFGDAIDIEPFEHYMPA